jgi:hypothetical protein
MYLVHDTDLNYFVFLDDDPRPAGFTGEVQEGVALEADEVGVREWSHGRARPEHVLSVADDDPQRFKVFCDKPGSGFHAVGADYVWDTTWTHYQLVRSGL